MDWKNMLDNFMFVSAVLLTLYIVPYQIRKGWNDAENKTRKVCDVCFRDIKKFNKVVKKFEEEKKNEC